MDVRREAIAAIEDEMRRVVEGRAKGSLVVVELDPDGDGILLVRSATAEREDQLTPQIEQLLRAADLAGFRPKLIVACAGVSGAKPLAERPDLVAVLEGLDEGDCSWVAVFAPDRIARSTTTVQRFLEELVRRRAGLYVMSLQQFERSVLNPAEGLTVALLCGVEFAATKEHRSPSGCGVAWKRSGTDVSAVREPT
jgi:hypothetical protein